MANRQQCAIGIISRVTGLLALNNETFFSVSSSKQKLLHVLSNLGSQDV